VVLLQGSQAYAKALAKAGILTQEESAVIVKGLEQVQFWL
jgi:argininosuccinate lyase